MNISSLNGTYTRQQLLELQSRRIAWSGLPDEKFEAKRNLVCNEALAALDTTPEALSVDIEDGEVVSVNVA